MRITSVVTTTIILAIAGGGLLLINTSQAAPPPNKDAAPWIGDTFYNAPCQGRLQKFGPYDYLLRNEYPSELKIVEDYHYNTEKHDLDYVLRAWPNHHPALYEIIFKQTNNRNGQRYKTPAECYAQRAVNFSPKDATARMLYALLLHRSGKPEEALKNYRLATQIDPDNSQIKYNMALLLVDMKQFNEARQIAQDVYDQGFPLPGLRNKLQRAGYAP